MDRIYRHTQVGYVTIAVMATAVVLLAVALVQEFSWLGLAVLCILIGAGICFSYMTIWIAGGRLYWRLGPGPIQKSVRLADIQSVQPVRNRWYYGWGIRYTPYGWLYNVSGLEGVQIRLHGGKTFRLGTDESHQLAAAIRQAAGES